MHNEAEYLMITQYPLHGTDASSIHTAELASHLALSGVRVRVVCPASRHGPTDMKVPCLMLPAFGRGVFRALTFQLALVPVLAALVVRTRIRCLYARHSGLLLVPAVMGLIFRLPVVLEVNGIVSEELPLVHAGRTGKAACALVGLIERLNFRLASGFVVVTHTLRQILIQEFGVDPARVRVVSNGANVSRFQPRAAMEARGQLGLRDTGPIVGFVGNLQPWHGASLLVEAAPEVLAQSPQALFLIVGDGPEGGMLKHRVEQLEIASSFVFIGAVPYAEVPLYMASMDVCAAPFPASERNSRIGGSPLKVFEYAACGRPIVLSTALPVWREIEEAGAGIVVEPDDSRALARALVEILRDSRRRQQMGKRAREFAVERGSWAHTAREVAAAMGQVGQMRLRRTCSRSSGGASCGSRETCADTLEAARDTCRR
jgi:glycosyltransferase involved in cell wall biosynthesis